MFILHFGVHLALSHKQIVDSLLPPIGTLHQNWQALATAVDRDECGWQFISNRENRLGFI